MRNLSIIFALIVLAIAAVIVGFWQSDGRDAPDSAVVSAKADGLLLAADFTLPLHGGGEARLSDLRNKKGAVVVFFTTWCPACVAKIPELRQLSAEAASHQIEVWGVNIGQDANTVAAFIKKHEINYPVLLDQNQSVARAYGVTGIPYIVGVDRDGRIRFQGHSLPAVAEIFSLLGSERAADADKTMP